MASQTPRTPPLSPAVSSVTVQVPIIEQKTDWRPNIYHPHLFPQIYEPHGYPSAPIPTPVPSEQPGKAGRARKGRMPGSQNWSKQDLQALARYVKGTAAPADLRTDAWRQIEGRYNAEYALPNARQARRWDNMRDKWNSLKSMGKVPVVDPGDIPEVLVPVEVGRDDMVVDDGANNTFVVSRPGASGSVHDDSSTAWQTKRGASASGSGSPSLASLLLSSIAPPASDDNGTRRHSPNEAALTRLYLRQIRSQEGTIREFEPKNYALQEQLYAAVRRHSREERRADRLKMRLEMMRTYRRRLARRHRARLSGPDSSASSTDSPRSRASSRLVCKRRRVDLQVAEEEKRAFREEDEEALRS